MITSPADVPRKKGLPRMEFLYQFFPAATSNLGGGYKKKCVVMGIAYEEAKAADRRKVKGRTLSTKKQVKECI